MLIISDHMYDPEVNGLRHTYKLHKSHIDVYHTTSEINNSMRSTTPPRRHPQAHNFIAGECINPSYAGATVLSHKAQGHKYFLKTSKPCHVGIHLIALPEYSRVSTNVRGLQSCFMVFCISLYWPNELPAA